MLSLVFRNDITSLLFPGFDVCTLLACAFLWFLEDVITMIRIRSADTVFFVVSVDSVGYQPTERLPILPVCLTTELVEVLGVDEVVDDGVVVVEVVDEEDDLFLFFDDDGDCFGS